MVNNTVNNIGNNIGKAAGKADRTSVNGLQVTQTRRGLDALAKATRKGNVLEEEFMTIKAYPGGNPNKVINNDELTH